MTTRYGFRQVGDVDVFYREAGPSDAPVILLLHGFPTASHMFRELIPLLADRFRLIAPDLPGFGQTKAPPRGTFDYTFEQPCRRDRGLHRRHRRSIATRSTSSTTVRRWACVWRCAILSASSAIVSQNGNAYVEGFSDEWGPWEAYWREPSAANREACRASLAPGTIRNWQYGTGADPNLLSPDGYELDIAYMARPGAEEIQLDLILDYRSNVALYPAFQSYFREHRPPLLAVWGRHDPAFLPAGAAAYQRDLPDAKVHLLDAGHFALETHAQEVATLIRAFLESAIGPATVKS